MCVHIDESNDFEFNLVAQRTRSDHWSMISIAFDITFFLRCLSTAAQLGIPNKLLYLFVPHESMIRINKLPSSISLTLHNIFLYQLDLISSENRSNKSTLEFPTFPTRKLRNCNFSHCLTRKIVPWLLWNENEISESQKRAQKKNEIKWFVNKTTFLLRARERENVERELSQCCRMFSQTPWGKLFCACNGRKFLRGSWSPFCGWISDLWIRRNLYSCDDCWRDFVALSFGLDSDAIKYSEINWKVSCLTFLIEL